MPNLCGANSLNCQNVSIKVDAVTATSPSTYSAKFILLNQAGTEIDNHTGSVGEDLSEQFFGSDGLKALADHVFVSSISVNTTTGVGSVELIVVPEHACS